MNAERRGCSDCNKSSSGWNHLTERRGIQTCHCYIWAVGKSSSLMECGSTRAASYNWDNLINLLPGGQISVTFNFGDTRWRKKNFLVTMILLDVAAGRFFSLNLCGILRKGTWTQPKADNSWEWTEFWLADWPQAHRCVWGAFLPSSCLFYLGQDWWPKYYDSASSHHLVVWQIWSITSFGMELVEDAQPSQPDCSWVDAEKISFLAEILTITQITAGRILFCGGRLLEFSTPGTQLGKGGDP